MPTNWYNKSEDNARKQIRQVHERRTRLREYVQSKKVACSICEYHRYVGALEFHHVSGNKEIQPSKMFMMGWGKERIDRELAKCIVLCANCHREVHAGMVSTAA